MAVGTIKAPRTLPAHQLREIAVEVGCDPRTVSRVVAGRPGQPLVADRIVPALRRRGVLPIGNRKRGRP